MRTQFRAEQLADPHMKDAEKALRTCVHCGFCTATCPTYVLLGDERDSPRGRIMLMQQMLERGAAPSRETVLHLDRCLSCLGCRTACPSGVDYAALIDQSRAHIDRTYRRPILQRLFRNFALLVLTWPRLFAIMLVLGRIASPVLSRIPGKFGAMVKKARRRPRARRRRSLAAMTVSESAPAVLIYPGCVQRVLAPGIDDAAASVLARQDMQILIAPKVECCGALAYHMGKTEIGKEHARQTILAFEAAWNRGPLHAALMTASGCCAFLKDYGRVFADDPVWRERAEAFSAQVKDFTEVAEARGQAPARELKIAYHPPCSLQHGQRVRGAGEKLLAAAGFRLVAFPDAHRCCGSAGSYSLLQPEIAEALREKKLAAVRTSGANMIVSGNIGCLTHLSGDIPTAHIAELLDWAAGGPKPI
jgi:glycolate oxidase iron-sulfur subunit